MLLNSATTRPYLLYMALYPPLIFVLVHVIQFTPVDWALFEALRCTELVIDAWVVPSKVPTYNPYFNRIVGLRVDARPWYDFYVQVPTCFRDVLASVPYKHKFEFYFVSKYIPITIPQEVNAHDILRIRPRV
jgi:hypothetical protein